VIEQTDLAHYDVVAFFDGIQLPLVSVVINQAMRQTTAELNVEPNDLLEFLKPRSRVSVFVRDPHKDLSEIREVVDNQNELPRNISQEELFKHAFYLYWEGEYAGFSESEEASVRTTTLHCVPVMSHLDSTALQMTATGSFVSYPLLNGSLFIDPVVDTFGQADYLGMIASRVFQQVKEEAEEDIDGPFFNYALRSVLFLSYVSTRHADLYMRLKRTRFFERVLALPDRLMATVLPRLVARTAFEQNMTNMVSSNGTVGDALDVLLGFGQYSRCDIVPHVVRPVDTTSSGTLATDAALSDKEVPAYNREGYVYGTIGLFPSLYYALPPRCNWLFPDHIQELQSSRNLLTEPTRLGLTDPNVTSFGLDGMIHVAPPSLSKYLLETYEALPKRTVAESRFNSASISAQNSPDVLDNEDIGTLKSTPLVWYTRDTRAQILDSSDPTADIYKGVQDGTTPSLLASMQPIELLKGIVYKSETGTFESLAAALLAKDETAIGAIKKALVTGDFFVNTGKKENIYYVNFMQHIAQYRLLMAQLSRGLTVSGPFNPDPQVGLPMVVLRDSRAYIGLLVGKADSINATGGASTVYTLEHVRLVPNLEVSESLIDSVVNHERDVRDVRRRLNQVDKQLEFFSKQTPKAIATKHPNFFSRTMNMASRKDSDNSKIGGAAYWDSHGSTNYPKNYLPRSTSGLEAIGRAVVPGLTQLQSFQFNAVERDLSFDDLFQRWADEADGVEVTENAQAAFREAVSEILTASVNGDDSYEAAQDRKELRRALDAMDAAETIVDRLHDAAVAWQAAYDQNMPEDTRPNINADDIAGDPWSERREGFLEARPGLETFYDIDQFRSHPVKRAYPELSTFSVDTLLALSQDQKYAITTAAYRPWIWSSRVMYSIANMIVAYLDNILRICAALYTSLQEALNAEKAKIERQVPKLAEDARTDQILSPSVSVSNIIPPVLPSARPDYLDPRTADILYRKYFGRIGNEKSTYAEILGDELLRIGDILKEGDPIELRLHAGANLLRLLSRVRDNYFEKREKSGESTAEFVYNFVHRDYIYGRDLGHVFPGMGIRYYPFPQQDEEDLGILEIRKEPLETDDTTQDDSGGAFSVIPQVVLPRFTHTEEDTTLEVSKQDSLVISQTITKARSVSDRGRIEEAEREATTLAKMTNDSYLQDIARTVFHEQARLPAIRRGR